MKTRAVFPAMVLVIGQMASIPADAAFRADIINGATCIPYPPYRIDVGAPYQFWLYGFSQSAYCHLTMPDNWRADELLYVFFHAGVSGDVLRARLCVHTGASLAVTCGPEETVTSTSIFTFVEAPSPVPPSASGAYVHFRFPSGEVSTIRELIPFWVD